MNNINKVDFTQLGDTLSIEVIDKDFALFDDISRVSFSEHSKKIHVTVSIICLKGALEMSINQKRYTFSENHIVTIHPNQILQYHYISDDFSGRFMVMSQNFLEMLQVNIEDIFPISIYMIENPAIQLSTPEIELCVNYYSMLDKAVKMRNNPNRIENVKYLILSLFYALNTFSQRYHKEQQTRKDVIFESFYKLIQLHHKENRTVNFYAKKMRLTPKYLTTVIREVTGKTANNWINEYVIRSAKFQLKSTNMTIQEISIHLSFPNQSFFGKYFKRYVGMSPGEYRKGK